MRLRNLSRARTGPSGVRRGRGGAFSPLARFDWSDQIAFRERGARAAVERLAEIDRLLASDLLEAELLAALRRETFRLRRRFAGFSRAFTGSMTSTMLCRRRAHAVGERLLG